MDSREIIMKKIKTLLIRYRIIIFLVFVITLSIIIYVKVNSEDIREEVAIGVQKIRTEEEENINEIKNIIKERRNVNKVEDTKSQNSINSTSDENSKKSDDSYSEESGDEYYEENNTEDAKGDLDENTFEEAVEDNSEGE